MHFLLMRQCLYPAWGSKGRTGGDSADERFPLRVLYHTVLSQTMAKLNTIKARVLIFIARIRIILFNLH
jgi:hypothetical protein